jgi:hypothetical protein
VSVKKALLFGSAALVVFFILSTPEGAADTVQSAFAGIGDAASAVGTFARGLFT